MCIQRKTRTEWQGNLVYLLCHRHFASFQTLSIELINQSYFVEHAADKYDKQQFPLKVDEAHEMIEKQATSNHVVYWVYKFNFLLWIASVRVPWLR